MCGNRIGTEGVKDVADVMKENNTISDIWINSCQITSAADCCHLSEDLALNTRLRKIASFEGCASASECCSNICRVLSLVDGRSILQLIDFETPTLF
jgi:hypothetical protein